MIRLNEAAARFNKDKGNLSKLLDKLGITKQYCRDSKANNQIVRVLSPEDIHTLEAYLGKSIGDGLFKVNKR